MNPPSGPADRRNWRTPHTPRPNRRNPNPHPGFSQSRSWHSPTRRAQQGTNSTIQLNEARKRICQNSPFWHYNFDMKHHKGGWQDGEVRRAQAVIDRRKKEEDERQRLKQIYGDDWVQKTPLPLRQPFDEKVFVGKDGETEIGNFGTVLSEQTVFCHNWEAREEDTAPWPNKHELEYEGDGRIATDTLHRRFLPLPRVNEPRLNWQQRAQIDPYKFDDFYAYVPRTFFPYYMPRFVDWEEVYMRSHVILDREFEETTRWDDAESWKRGLGTELLGLLDPQDQWT